MAKTYFIITYGCQMNEHDSERIAGLLHTRGYEQAQIKESADLIIVNTCCVRESAERKILGNIGWLKILKEEKKHLKIFICGCMVEQEYIRTKLQKSFLFVDGVFSTNDLSTLEQLLNSHMRKNNFTFTYTPATHESEDMQRNTYPLSFVNVMYGCDNFCSYCIVPYVRGRERSRELSAIVDEVKKLKDEGYGEVMLLGQNVNSYGRELGITFTHLLYEVAKTGFPRIRFMTSHPKDLTDSLISAFGEIKTLCPSIHLPVQSGSDRILNLMNRKYDTKHYKRLTQKLRETVPHITISTDIIVGFPGETEEDFEDTLRLVKEVGFDSAYTFVYSKRSGTKAAEMEGQIDEEVKKERIVRLISLQNEITYEKNKAQVGCTRRVLVESKSRRNEGEMCGRCEDNRMVNFAGDEHLIGKIFDIHIERANKTTLSGRIV